MILFSRPDCSGFKALDDKGTFESVRKSGACFDCMEHKTCDVVGTNGQMPGRYHHPILHPIHVLSLYNSNIDSNRVLLMISQVKSYNMPVTILWDHGANVSLITHEAARRLGLRCEHTF